MFSIIRRIVNYGDSAISSTVLKQRLCPSLVWRYVIAVDDNDLNYHGSVDARKSRQVANVANGMLASAGGPLVDEDFDVYICRYRYYIEWLYSAKLCDMPAEQLDSWRGVYMVHPDVICCERSILPYCFRYIYRLESVYCTQQVRWKYRTLSALGRFVPYHMCCCYNFLQTAHVQLFH